MIITLWIVGSVLGYILIATATFYFLLVKCEVVNEYCTASKYHGDKPEDINWDHTVMFVIASALWPIGLPTVGVVAMWLQIAACGEKAKKRRHRLRTLVEEGKHTES